MKRYAKFGYAAPFRFRVILEKPQGGGQNDPPPTRAKVKVKKATNYKILTKHLLNEALITSDTVIDNMDPKTAMDIPLHILSQPPIRFDPKSSKNKCRVKKD